MLQHHQRAGLAYYKGDCIHGLVAWQVVLLWRLMGHVRFPLGGQTSLEKPVVCLGAGIGLVVAAVFLLWERAVSSPQAAAMALLAFGSVAFFRAPAPLVILGSGALGWGYSLL